MNHRERVLAALNHQEPDMVPVDLGGHRSSGIAAIAYAKLRKHLGLEDRPVWVYDMIQQLAVIDNDVLELFGVDTIELGRGFLLDDKDWKDWILPDGTDCQIPYFVNVEKRGEHSYLLADDGTELAVQKKGCLYFEQSLFPLMGRNIETEDFSDLPEIIKHVVWTAVPHPGAHLPLTEEGLAEMEYGAKMLRQSTDRAIIFLAGGSMFELGHYIFGMENYLTYLGLYPDAIHRFSEKLCQIHLKNMEKLLSAVGPYIDIVCFGGDDLGTQHGPMISPAMYREFIKPYHRKLWNRAKELTDARVMLHCCGAISELLPDMIDAGLDAVNPVQISCVGMDTATLKRDFGNDLTFWGGGCDTHDVLPNRSSVDIAKHIRRQIKSLSSNGGFVFQQVHNIQANVPPENIVTMFEVVNKTLTTKTHV